jgi:hypothetical protein
MGTSWRVLRLLSNSRPYKGRSSLYKQESCFTGKVREVAVIQEKNLTNLLYLQNIEAPSSKTKLSFVALQGAGIVLAKHFHNQALFNNSWKLF